eukprot:TRINITY_DN63690_c0_g1_i1.p1 TRINITY_DN63690_c0_g1~~TRINITY_DN63690_c0_g1_i1.p1  ORF type:complete len:383 (+),score=62.87 TRINITY_DN63690_c0_g1_i1:90-1238(+)
MAPQPGNMQLPYFSASQLNGSLDPPSTTQSTPRFDPHTTDLRRGLSPSTETDLDLARWEALRNMVEAEQEVRCRTVSDIEAMLSSLPAAANSVLGLQESVGSGEGQEGQASFGPAREAFALLVACLRQELQQKLANLEAKIEARINEVVATEREARLHELADLELKLKSHCHAAINEAVATISKDSSTSVFPKVTPGCEVRASQAQPKIDDAMIARMESPQMQRQGAALQISPSRGASQQQHGICRQASPDPKQSPVSRQTINYPRHASSATFSPMLSSRDTISLSPGPCIPQLSQRTLSPMSASQAPSSPSSVSMLPQRPFSPSRSPGRSQGTEISSVRVGFMPAAFAGKQPGSPLASKSSADKLGATMVRPTRLTLVANR